MGWGLVAVAAAAAVARSARRRVPAGHSDGHSWPCAAHADGSGGPPGAGPHRRPCPSRSLVRSFSRSQPGSPSSPHPTTAAALNRPLSSHKPASFGGYRGGCSLWTGAGNCGSRPRGHHVGYGHAGSTADRRGTPDRTPAGVAQNAHVGRPHGVPDQHTTERNGICYGWRSACWGV